MLASWVAQTPESKSLITTSPDLIQAFSPSVGEGRQQRDGEKDQRAWAPGGKLDPLKTLSAVDWLVCQLRAGDPDGGLIGWALLKR